jgi:hypothetical protein
MLNGFHHEWFHGVLWLRAICSKYCSM